MSPCVGCVSQSIRPYLTPGPYTGHTQAQGSNQGTFYPRQLMTLTLNKPSYAPRFINHSRRTLKHLTQRQVFGSDLILSSDSVREVVL